MAVVRARQNWQLREPGILAAVVAGGLMLSAAGPRSWGTWALEIAPVVIGLVVVVATRRRFALTPVTYRALAVAAMMVLLGAHYTFAEVPPGYWLRDWWGGTRNHYDRIGHFTQGVVAALLVREVLSRMTPLRARWWLFGVVTTMCLGISAGFELLEAIAAALSGQAGDAYLGTQGDPFDAQWDMTCALTGAVAAQLLLGRQQDRRIAALRSGGAAGQGGP